VHRLNADDSLHWNYANWLRGRGSPIDRLALASSAVFHAENEAKWQQGGDRYSLSLFLKSPACSCVSITLPASS
jgi:hypothetical protein